MALTKGFVRNAATTPLDARLMDQARLVQNVDGSTRTGVLGYLATLVTTTATTTPMTVNVAQAPLVASRNVGDGAVVFTNDGTTAVTIPAAPGSNSRLDVIWARHQDDTAGDVAGLASPIFGVTSGSAAASPTEPAIPTGAVKLAVLRIYAGTTATNGGANTLTQAFQMTAASGGEVPFRTKAELDLWTTAQQGQKAYVIATGVDYVRVGASWEVAYGPSGVDANGWTWITMANGKRRFFRYFVEWSAPNPFGAVNGSFWSQTRQGGILPPTGTTWDIFAVNVMLWGKTAANGLQQVLQASLSSATGSGAVALNVFNPTSVAVANTSMDLRSSIELIEL